MNLRIGEMFNFHFASMLCNALLPVQVDADYKLQDLKKMLKELEIKEKGYNEKLKNLNKTLSNHMEQ